MLPRASLHLFLPGFFSAEPTETAAARGICRRMRGPEEAVIKHCHLCFVLPDTRVLWALLAEQSRGPLQAPVRGVHKFSTASVFGLINGWQPFKWSQTEGHYLANAMPSGMLQLQTGALQAGA